MKTNMLTALTLASVIAIFALGQTKLQEPRYADKGITAWLNDLNSLDPSIWCEAENAVRIIGSNALPVLAKRLQAKDSLLKSKAIDFCEDFPVIVLEPAEIHYDSALAACRILGPEAAPIVPDIVGFLEGHYRTHAVKALIAIGDSAVQPLVAALEREPARAGAAIALGTLVCQPRITVPALLEHLNDSNAETRTAVVWALGRFGADAQSTIPQLSALTNDSSFSVREQASRALRTIGSQSVD